jgi:hypothetical protein
MSTMIAHPLTCYFITSIAGSTVVGAAHGWFTSRDLTVTASHAMHGLFLGPWAPIAVPYMLLRPFNKRCSFINKFH